jgi:ribosomal protein S25
MTTKTPTILTIKILASTAPSVKEVEAALAQFGSMLQYEAVNLVFDGSSLVPAPAPTVPATTPVVPETKVKRGGIKPEKHRDAVRKAQVSQAAKRAQDKRNAGEPKPINLEEGSNPERIFSLIRSGPAVTSTQIREKLGLDSNIVNTTVYRLKNAGMIRPMSYNAPNGDTLYTSTEFDPKPTTEVTDGNE